MTKAMRATPIKMGKPFSKRDKPKKSIKNKSYLGVDPTQIANKMKRHDILFKKKRQLKLLKASNRKER